MIGLRDAYRVSLALTLAALAASLFVQWKSVKHEREDGNDVRPAVGA